MLVTSSQSTDDSIHTGQGVILLLVVARLGDNRYIPSSPVRVGPFLEEHAPTERTRLLIELGRDFTDGVMVR